MQGESDIANIIEEIDAKIETSGRTFIMRRFRQKLYRTRIGARQKQPFLNHLLLIINFFTCFSQITLEKLSLIGALH